MKKTLSLLALSVAMVFLLCGCLGGENPAETAKTAPQETVAGDRELQDEDVPILEETDSVAIGDMLPEVPGEVDENSQPEYLPAELIEENDSVEIGEIL